MATWKWCQHGSQMNKRKGTDKTFHKPIEYFSIIVYWRNSIISIVIIIRNYKYLIQYDFSKTFPFVIYLIARK